ncbi:MAG: hypothetical protein ABSB35_37985 [Bryobacteraceae bacterium]|jgi:primary-amine oxidase
MALPSDVDLGFSAQSEIFRHPLDPMNASELEEVVRILEREECLGDGVRIASVNLIEPAKTLVQAHQPRTTFERMALAVLLDRFKRTSYEAVVDLNGKSVASVTQLPPGVQPSIMLDEFSECEQAVRRSPVFQAALRKRGVTDPDLVMVEPWSAGTYGTESPEEQGLRRMRALFSYGPSRKTTATRGRSTAWSSWWICTRWR